MRTPLAVALVAVVAAGCATQKQSAAPARPAEPVAQASAKAPAEMTRIVPSPNYALTTCVISGEELGPVDERIAYSYAGTEVQFCCPHCVVEFKKDPDKYLAKIAAAGK